ncbi:MAG: MerR family transcriptional regulator [Candidatus Magnetominusculus sp. LBB02]|nr:MerR family transcriptional regulator [Candidatus Magnetominusculus sp. LBB02]
MSKRDDSSRPLYVISVVAEMFDLHPQTLRLYEREGFIAPARQNNQRKYSDEDLKQLEFIVDLTRKLGVNKAGLEIIMDMRGRLDAMRKEMEGIMDYLEEDTKRHFQNRLQEIFYGDRR